MNPTTSGRHTRCLLEMHLPHKSVRIILYINTNRNIRSDNWINRTPQVRLHPPSRSVWSLSSFSPRISVTLPTPRHWAYHAGHATLSNRWCSPVGVFSLPMCHCAEVNLRSTSCHSVCPFKDLSMLLSTHLWCFSELLKKQKTRSPSEGSEGVFSCPPRLPVILKMCSLTKRGSHCLEIHPRRHCWVIKQVHGDLSECCDCFSESLSMLPSTCIARGFSFSDVLANTLLSTCLTSAIWQYKVSSWVDHFSFF